MRHSPWEQNLRGSPKKSVIKINSILMHCFKEIELSAKKICGEQKYQPFK